jgi:hypothetical protein
LFKGSVAPAKLQIKPTQIVHASKLAPLNRFPIRNSSIKLCQLDHACAVINARGTTQIAVCEARELEASKTVSKQFHFGSRIGCSILVA